MKAGELAIPTARPDSRLARFGDSHFPGGRPQRSQPGDLAIRTVRSPGTWRFPLFAARGLAIPPDLPGIDTQIMSSA